MDNTTPIIKKLQQIEFEIKQIRDELQPGSTAFDEATEVIFTLNNLMLELKEKMH